MAVSLNKGGNVSLSKEAPGLTAITVGLGWDPRATDGKEFDLDASAFTLKADGKIRADGDFIFYNNKVSSDGSVVHNGNNRTGDGEGDDETIDIDLSKVPAEVDKVAITVTIDEADTRGQSFGQVGGAFIRVMNKDGGAEIARYDLSEDYSTETAVVFGEIYRSGSDWKFRAMGQGYAGGLAPMAHNFGVNV
ncbi:TerD family protein [Deinococcus psychrotolerans]|uniref:TerD family protein n=1 Tax=Deinococcus psychrotolerans TaxID=2489213 RepID=A0A3G8YGR7_9DEIO|nr:TerD family protein [Deinococcus psychrotolerans]AZI44163.1 TerD family protein [Deinococcus psychrotolerans]